MFLKIKIFPLVDYENSSGSSVMRGKSEWWLIIIDYQDNTTLDSCKDDIAGIEHGIFTAFGLCEN